MRQWLDKALKAQLRELAWTIDDATTRDDPDNSRLAAELVHRRQGSLADLTCDHELINLTWKTLRFHNEFHYFLTVKFLQKVESE